MSTPKRSTPKIFQNVYSSKTDCDKMSVPDMSTVPKCLLPKCLFLTLIDILYLLIVKVNLEKKATYVCLC